LYTASEGSTSAADCQPIACPQGSNGPDADQDCSCPKDSQCIGDDSLCLAHENGVEYFSVTCSACTCTEPSNGAAITEISSPNINTAWVIGNEYEITYDIAGAINKVFIGL